MRKVSMRSYVSGILSAVWQDQMLDGAKIPGRGGSDTYARLLRLQQASGPMKWAKRGSTRCLRRRNSYFATRRSLKSSEGLGGM